MFCLNHNLHLTPARFCQGLCRFRQVFGFSIFLLFLTVGLPAQAQQDASRFFSKYTTSNGLLINSVYDVARSRNGMRWVGSAAGLQRFDGYSFENWTEPADPAIKTNPGVQQIYEDSTGNVWVSNFTYHYVYPKGKKKYERVTVAKHIPPPLIFMMFITEQQGRIWCFEGNRGIYGLNTQTKQIDTLIPVSFQSSNPTIGASSIPFLAVDDSNTVWITQDFPEFNYILGFKPGQKPVVRYFPVSKYGRVKALIPLGGDEFLFLGTKYAAVCRNGDIESPVAIISNQNIPGNFIRKFSFLKLKNYHRGNILFSGERGLYEYDRLTKTISPFLTSSWPEISLNRQFLFDLEEDDLGNIWMARDASDGLLVFHPMKMKFNFLQGPPAVSNIIYSLAVHEDGRVVSAGYQKGLNIFDKNGKWSRYVALPGNEDGLSPSMRCLSFIDRDHLLMKSLFGKLAVLDMRDYSVKDLSNLVPSRVARLKNAFDANLTPLSAGKMQTVHSKYILTIEKKADDYEVRVTDSLLSVDRITCSIIGHDGKPAIGTTEGCYEKKGDSWAVLPGTEGFYVKHLLYRSNGDLWIATINGILVLRNHKLIHHYNQANGMLNNFIYGILEDNDDNAWFSSNKGLGCIRRYGSMEFYTSADGVQGDEFDTQSFCKGSDGMLYFGGTNGITSFFPKQVFRTSARPKALISSIKINGDVFPREGRVEDVHSLDLHHNQNAVSIDFSLSDFKDPEYITYRVRMSGYDDTLISLRNTRTARYLLPPGKYQLHISGSNDGNGWSDEIILPIVVHPPWWQTTGFIILEVLLGALILFGGVYWYASRKTQKLRQQLVLQHEMQKERERISRDLHDNIGAYSTAMIAGTESLEHSLLLPDSREKLADLKTNARNILTSIRETIWLLNSRNLNIRGFVDGYINYSTNILRNYEGVDMEFTDQIDKNPEMSPATAINLLRILQEVLQNILKHSGASRISCSIDSGEWLSISVKDNGRGFDPSKAIMGNGLENMRHRAEEIGFNLQISSGVDGTEVRLSGRVG